MNHLYEKTELNQLNYKLYWYAVKPKIHTPHKYTYLAISLIMQLFLMALLCCYEGLLCVSLGQGKL